MLQPLRRVRLAILVLLCSIQPVHAAVTPTEVFVEAKALKGAMAETALERANATTVPLIDMGLSGAKPYHVFALAMALNEKIGIYMETRGVNGFERATFPEEKVTPGHVRDLVMTAQRNFAKAEPGTKLLREPATGKKPADVMREVTFANLWVDALMGGKVQPQWAFWALKRINHELLRLESHLGLSIDRVSPKTHLKATPAGVFTSAEIFYRMLALADAMNFGDTTPAHPYDIPSSGIPVKPVHVFSLTAFNLFYLYTVEKKLGLEPHRTYTPALRAGVKPTDVYREYDRANYLLARVIANLGGKQ